MTEIATIDWFGRWGTSVFSEKTAIFVTVFFSNFRDTGEIIVEILQGINVYWTFLCLLPWTWDIGDLAIQASYQQCPLQVRLKF